MAKKKRSPSPKSGNAPVQALANVSAGEAALPSQNGRKGDHATQHVSKTAVVDRVLALPGELGKGDWTAIILALMMFFTPTLGVPNELMLQDTLKSIIVSFMTLSAALLLFWSQRNRRDALRWHAVMWLPVALCAYALGSMVWSHTFLAGVEAIRWFIFALIAWLTLNSLSRERFPMLAWGIHLGALGVALLGASQYWFDVKFIPQGPNPAATFVNRNFAAEYMVCTLPFTAYLIFTHRRPAVLAFLSSTAGFFVVYLLMCGTRSAYVAAAFSVASIALMAWVFRRKFSFSQWRSEQVILVLGVLLCTIVGLGLIKSGNSSPEFKDANVFQRGSARAASISINDGTFNVRKIMWSATQTMITKRPLSGVGAGAWEVDIPLYQAEGSQLETDYYVHNEFLQLLGEYGLVGWLVLLGLVAYSLSAAWRTLANRSEEGMSEGPIRAVALTSLLALMVVSNIGFPWRLASTGAIFAICLGLLAASDARMGRRGIFSSARLRWGPAASQTAAVLTMLCLVLAAYITQQAAEAESKIVSAVKMALSISQTGDPNNPKHDKLKAEMLKTAREGIAINPHYRKITPMMGDELAKWGNWKDAVWVWESVVGSRPYVVAISTNIARGYAAIGNVPKALEFMEKAKRVQPKAVSLRSLEVILLSRGGREPDALKLARQSMQEGTVDYDLLSSAYVLGIRASDFKFAIEAMEQHNRLRPDLKTDGFLKIANVQFNFLHDEAKAIENYKLALSSSVNPTATLAQIPPAFHAKLIPSATPAQNPPGK